jgi:hypothetical protein
MGKNIQPDLTEAWWEWCMALLLTGLTEALRNANSALAQLELCPPDVVEAIFRSHQQAEEHDLEFPAAENWDDNPTLEKRALALSHRPLAVSSSSPNAKVRAS